MTIPSPLVLIVEDNERNMKLERDVLELHGFRVIEARTAAEGIALAAERLPDVVLMDIRLPDMDGVAALGCLRGDPRTASICVVAITSSAMSDGRRRFFQAGFDGYLAKPLDIRSFPSQVASFCRSAASEERAAEA